MKGLEETCAATCSLSLRLYMPRQHLPERRAEHGTSMQGKTGRLGVSPHGLQTTIIIIIAAYGVGVLLQDETSKRQ